MTPSGIESATCRFALTTTPPRVSGKMYLAQSEGLGAEAGLKLYSQIRALKNIFNLREGMTLLCATMHPTGPFSVNKSPSLFSRVLLEKPIVFQVNKQFSEIYVN
jgi:hypothetical protein